jgi:hypothetical protein
MLNNLFQSDPTSDTDLVHGQMVILVARWILVLAGLFVTLMNPGNLDLMRFQIMCLLAMALANFYLCAQVLQRRPMLRPVMYGASLVDLVAITAICAFQGGFRSEVQAFYYPALLAISVAFSPVMLFLFTGGAMSAYTLICLFTLPAPESDPVVLVIRLLLMAAVAVCGNRYWQLEHPRQAPAKRAPAPARAGTKPLKPTASLKV